MSTTTLLQAIQSGDTGQVRELLQNNPSLLQETKGPPGESPLLLAVNHGHPEIAALLLDQGADINVRQAGGYTPLHLAAQQGNEQLIKLLLERMADINATTDDGLTPMELAIKHGHDAGKWFTL